MDYIGESVTSVTSVTGSEFDYHLTWPATQPGICCIAGQWKRNEAGEIEAWYSAEQLRIVLAAMQAAGGHDERTR